MRKLIAVAFMLSCVPAFASVHAVSRTAKATYKVSKATVKPAAKVVKFAAKQLF